MGRKAGDAMKDPTKGLPMTRYRITPENMERGDAMTQWHTEYIPTPNPAECRKGWKFPYQGDEWPTQDDWYWTWTGKRICPAIKRWWCGKEQRFLAAKDEVIAWKKMKIKKVML